ncbi:C4-dicarboxylate transporter [Noviherbaspirillum cavernae]|uniref:C4-dicarboxylate transporter n=1 Tax=Noviherbaspirillum cavernae TaxID=2320862 RepID=A0A418WV42_9BURK|nr:TRAP transporter substrate-binding protein [Noviherbaspirillum cavernae]RJF96576.1 C4-dicarboxylate transporter [Noviherbaspirillum cavernae]
MKFHRFAAIGCLAVALPVAAQEFTIKVAHFLPPAAPAQVRVLQPWCDALKKDSGSRIACQIYPAMQLGGTPAQLVDQVRNGVADVVWTAPGYSTGRFPLIEAFELPFMISDASSGSRAAWKFYQQHAQQEFSAFKMLALHVDGGQAVHTAKKEVKSVADWKGQKLRSSTRLGAKTLIALGATPVAMPPAQVTEAISKGVVDGAMGAWEVVLPTKLDEVAKLHSQPPTGQPYPSTTVLMLLMNKQKFDGMPADLKAIIDRHSGAELVERFGRVWDEEATNSRKKVLASGGQIIDFTPAEMAAMRSATASVDEDWIRQVTEKGHDGKRLAAAARTLATGQ